jgi:hypothetical protein
MLSLQSNHFVHMHSGIQARKYGGKKTFVRSLFCSGPLATASVAIEHLMKTCSTALQQMQVPLARFSFTSSAPRGDVHLMETGSLSAGVSSPRRLLVRSVSRCCVGMEERRAACYVACSQLASFFLFFCNVFAETSKFPGRHRRWRHHGKHVFNGDSKINAYQNLPIKPPS